jgi:hypothetical protein
LFVLLALLGFFSVGAPAQSSYGKKGVVWMPFQSDGVDSAAAGKKPLDKGQAMAWEFGTGFKTFSDSLGIDVIWLDEFPEGVFRVGDQRLEGYAALSSWLVQNQVGYVIGPLKAESSLKLAQAWKSGVVVNPLSRTVNSSVPNLWAATPSDADEAFEMGRYARALCADRVVLVPDVSSGAAVADRLASFEMGKKAPSDLQVKASNGTCRVYLEQTTAGLLKAVGGSGATDVLLLTGTAAESPSLEPRTFMQKQVFWTELETWDFKSAELAQWAGRYQQQWQMEPSRWAYHGMAMAAWAGVQLSQESTSVPANTQTPFKGFVWRQRSATSGNSNHAVRWIKP